MYKTILNPNNRKWIIVGTLFIAIICNYLDRQLLSILKPEILEHFHISDFEYAWIVNIFLICYALMYPLSGWLIDHFGPKRVLLVGIAAWSLACIGGGYAPNIWLFAMFRGILGLAEPTIFAGQLVAVTLWFEKKQRATANSLCTIGGSLGAVIAPIVIAWLMHIVSTWQHVFILSGIIGLIIAFIWFFVYKTPSDDILKKTLSDNDTLSKNETTSKKFSIKELFRTKTLWGGILIRLISDPVWYFCCFWLPGFLRNMGTREGLTTRQTLDMIQWIGGIPFLVGAIGGVLTSMWSDYMVKRGKFSSLTARKISMIAVAAAAPLCMAVPFISDSGTFSFHTKIALIITIFSFVAVMCLSWLYTLPVVLAESFPIKNAATVMGICCGAGALGSIVFNQFIGTLSQQDWVILFILMGTLHLITSLILWKMVRKNIKQNNIIKHKINLSQDENNN